MCGIVGIAGRHDLDWVRRMNSNIRHRGPDDKGLYQSPDGLVSLAMRRLSIIDLQTGHQPMHNEDASIWIVFNGEIFNAPEIRSRLEHRGHKFVTANSDTEVLLHLYEEKGPSLLDDLNGMFAFVIHDHNRKVLFGARDRMGIKPLYYCQSAGRFVFASELKSILTLPFIEREIDRQSLFHYMTLLYVPDEASIITGIHRIPPAHSFVYDLSSKEFKLHRYWQLKFEADEDHSEEEWAEVLRAELRAAVRRWSLSDVPLACSLSGGLDSSAVVGLMAEAGYPRIKTYSLGFDGTEEQAWNEIDLARQVAQRWGADHHEIILEPKELLSDLASMVWHLDEPYGGGLPSWYVFREMSRDVKVGLTGTGGDELFGNYGKFRIYESNKFLQASLASRRWADGCGDVLALVMSPLAMLSNSLPSSWRWIGRGHLLSQLPRMISEPFGRYYHATLEYLSDDRKRAGVLRVQNGRVQDTASYLQNLYDNSAASDLRNGLAAVDFRTQLAEEFLFMTDRFSMAHGLEARVPFLDHLLVELVFRIPPAMRTKAGDLKYLFKRAIGDLLPAPLLTARKRGFVIPTKLWLRSELRPLVERLLHPERLHHQDLFDSKFYDSFVLPHLEARADFTAQVWAALMFQIWHLIFVEQKQTEAPGFDWRAIAELD
jgi:asparagine synthase (glutamine-hydrolysing)